MKRFQYFFLICLLFICGACSCQNPKTHSAKEKSYIELFKSFTQYLETHANNKVDITDSVHLKYILLHYLYVDSKPDSISTEQLNSLKKQLNTFYRYMHKDGNEMLFKNLSVIPIRFASSKSVYNNLTPFQKENTLVLIDERFPKKIIQYILFMPPTSRVIVEPRIWSWTLSYQYGKYMFKGISGEEGYEYIFSK